MHKSIDLKKELIENSLDAKSTQISLYLDNYGKETITISDNGHGIDSSNFDVIL